VNSWAAATTASVTQPIPLDAYRTTAGGGAGQTNPAPFTSLATAFGGLTTADINGSWTISVHDTAGGDTGTLNAGQIILIIDGMPFLDGFESGDTSAWSSTSSP